METYFSASARLAGGEGFSAGELEAVEAAWRHCPVHGHTPIIEAGSIARDLGLGRVWLKDESRRSSLSSFKALGGTHAVIRLLAEKAGLPINADLLAAPAFIEAARETTVCSATDGNHGRAVATGARLVGASCVIYVHEHVAPLRRELLEETGARVIVVEGDYDDAVRACREAAVENGWQLVADTAGSDEDPRPPRYVMQGYSIMVREAIEQLRGERPTHVFVQAGVGGLAAAVAATLAGMGLADAKLVLVEPSQAACLLAAARAGQPVELEGDIESAMAMLSCGEASAPAWEILAPAISAIVTIEDRQSERAARRLAGLDPAETVRTSPSGAAGLAGLEAALRDRVLSEKLGLGADSKVLVFVTEGDIEGALEA